MNHFSMLTIKHMVTVQTFDGVSDTFKVMGTCTGRNYAMD
jgi:hypothetical protein